MRHKLHRRIDQIERIRQQARLDRPLPDHAVVDADELTATHCYSGVVLPVAHFRQQYPHGLLIVVRREGTRIV